MKGLSSIFSSCGAENGVVTDDAQRAAGKTVLTRPAMRLGLLILLLVIGWGVVSWLLAENWVHKRSLRMIAREREVASSVADSVGEGVGFTLAYMRSIPKVLAKQTEIETVLSGMGVDVRRTSSPQLLKAQLEKKPELIDLRKRLESILSDLDIEQILIMNASGDCIASAGFTADESPVGVNYSDRQYFQIAMQGEMGRQFAVGRTTKSPGIYYASAVVSAGRIVGVATVKINVSQLSRMGVDRNTLISDKNGVIILSGDADFYLKAIPESKVNEFSVAELERLYQKNSIPMLGINPLDVSGFQLFGLEGRQAPMLKSVSHNKTDLLTIQVFREVSELSGIDEDEKWVFIFLLISGASVIGGIVAQVLYLRRTKEHQLEISRVNAELLLLNEDLSVQARFDALTGCGNRRHFFEELGTELQRSARFDFSCCLALLDIDHFKAVNDLYGHAAGDAVLVHFSETVRQCLRSTDLLCRIGGEEFALLMPQTVLEGGLWLVERVRLAVENSSIEFGAAKIDVTASIGIVQWMGSADSIEAFIARADDAMYAAKRSGRNRVCIESIG